MRDVYKRGQLKVGTADIQSQKYNVVKELARILDNRQAKHASIAEDPVAVNVVTWVASGFDRLMQMGGGVCQGLVYAWFASLREGRTNLDFDREAGGWTDARKEVAGKAAENQARMTARFASRETTMGTDAAKARAGRKLAKESGFSETEVCYATVSHPAIDAVVKRVITEDHPRCYRISLKSAAGRHSIGVVRKGNLTFLLDPNVGIVAYDRRDRLVEDLTDILMSTDLERGYAARSIRVFAATADPVAAPVESGDNIDDLLAAFLAS